ncbi:MAG TPA: inositol monophosphatase family protein [Acidobacteriota bacterium]|nr:inositol monophosphatase family protein [Acidobacteriota bacterium]
MIYERELELSLELVRNTGDLALQFFDQSTPAEEKADSSPVTIADRECEKLIRGTLQNSFPEDGILGEEGTRIPSRSGRRWIIDPIDGTRDFVRHNPFWSVQLALQVGERVELGIIYCPCTNEMLFAASGQGCYWNNTRVSGSDIARVDKAILMVSGFKAAWDSWPEGSVQHLTKTCWTVRCYGGCYDIIMLARGKADIWLSGSGMEWDYAPVQVIARECGAPFLTRDGTDRIDQKHCVVCAPGIERDVRNILGIQK